MNRIEIDELNYQDYQHLDIVAYSFARGGTMGDPGGIKIVLHCPENPESPNENDYARRKRLGIVVWCQKKEPAR